MLYHLGGISEPVTPCRYEIHKHVELPVFAGVQDMIIQVGSRELQKRSALSQLLARIVSLREEGSC